MFFFVFPKHSFQKTFVEDYTLETLSVTHHLHTYLPLDLVTRADSLVWCARRRLTPSGRIPNTTGCYNEAQRSAQTTEGGWAGEAY